MEAVAKTNTYLFYVRIGRRAAGKAKSEREGKGGGVGGDGLELPALDIRFNFVGFAARGSVRGVVARNAQSRFRGLKVNRGCE